MAVPSAAQVHHPEKILGSTGQSHIKKAPTSTENRFENHVKNEGENAFLHFRGN